MKHSAKPETSLQDQLISIAAGIIEEALDDLDGYCASCNAMVGSRCDYHEGTRVRIEDTQAILRKLESAKDDDGALAIIAGIPSLALAVAGMVNTAETVPSLAEAGSAA
jgi:hypothetical protein